MCHFYLEMHTNAFVGDVIAAPKRKCTELPRPNWIMKGPREGRVG